MQKYCLELFLSNFSSYQGFGEISEKMMTSAKINDVIEKKKNLKLLLLSTTITVQSFRVSIIVVQKLWGAGRIRPPPGNNFCQKARLK